ncbi:MAG: hypothetical protein K1X83_05000 [Oligoflexia bacterium]|nr:hypothetical protein [Oligoflexia bacterium]
MLHEKISLSELRALAFRIERESKSTTQAESSHVGASEEDPADTLLSDLESSGEWADLNLSLACDQLAIPYLAKWEGRPAPVPEFIKEQLYGKPYGPGLVVDYQGQRCLVVDMFVSSPEGKGIDRSKPGALAQIMFEMCAWADLKEIPEDADFDRLYLIDATLVDLQS